MTVNALHPATLMDTKMVRGTARAVAEHGGGGGEGDGAPVADPELDGVSGRFFNGTRETRADAQAYDADARRRLWEESERRAWGVG